MAPPRGGAVDKRGIFRARVTSQVRSPTTFGEVIVQNGQAAKLLKLSAIEPVFTTLDKRLVRNSLSRLHETDRASLKNAMQALLG